MGFTGFYWVLLGFTGFYWILLGFTGLGRGCRTRRCADGRTAGRADGRMVAHRRRASAASPIPPPSFIRKPPSFIHSFIHSLHPPHLSTIQLLAQSFALFLFIASPTFSLGRAVFLWFVFFLGRPMSGRLAVALNALPEKSLPLPVMLPNFFYRIQGADSLLVTQSDNCFVRLRWR